MKKIFLYLNKKNISNQSVHGSTPTCCKEKCIHNISFLQLFKKRKRKEKKRKEKVNHKLKLYLSMKKIFLYLNKKNISNQSVHGSTALHPLVVKKKVYTIFYSFIIKKKKKKKKERKKRKEKVAVL